MYNLEEALLQEACAKALRHNAELNMDLIASGFRAIYLAFEMLTWLLAPQKTC